MARISEDMRQRMIAEAAYYRAERHGFIGDDPVNDWLAAEAEIEALLDKEPAGIGVFEERLAMANERLAAFRQWLAESKSDVRDEWEDEARKLAKQRDKLRKRTAEIRDAGEHAAEEAWHKAEAAWADIAESIHRWSHRDAHRQ